MDKKSTSSVLASQRSNAEVSNFKGMNAKPNDGL